MKTPLPVALILLACCARADQTINVTGDAEIKIPPDQVVVSLGVEVHAKELAEARHENDRRVIAIKAAVAKLGVPEMDIQTDFIQMGIAYAIPGGCWSGDGVTPLYYYTRKSIVITVHDVSKMEDTLGAAVDAGATHIHGVDFQTAKLREYRDQARAMAVKAATEKAHDMAKAAGLQVIGGPTSISSYNYGGRSWYGSWWGGAAARERIPRTSATSPIPVAEAMPGRGRSHWGASRSPRTFPCSSASNKKILATDAHG